MGRVWEGRYAGGRLSKQWIRHLRHQHPVFHLWLAWEWALVDCLSHPQPWSRAKVIRSDHGERQRLQRVERCRQWTLWEQARKWVVFWVWMRGPWPASLWTSIWETWGCAAFLPWGWLLHASVCIEHRILTIRIDMLCKVVKNRQRWRKINKPSLYPAVPSGVVGMSLQIHNNAWPPSGKTPLLSSVLAWMAFAHSGSGWLGSFDSDMPWMSFACKMRSSLCHEATGSGLSVSRAEHAARYLSAQAEIWVETQLTNSQDLVLALGVRGPGNQRKHLEYIAGSGWKYLPLTHQ